MDAYPKSERISELDDELSESIPWTSSLREGGFIYVALHHSKRYEVRMNDFPDEPMYTLLVDDEEIMDFDDWPSRWEMPDERKK